MTDDRLADLLDEWQRRCAHGLDVPAADLCGDHPELAPDLAWRIAVLRHIQRLAAPPAPDAVAPPTLELPGIGPDAAPGDTPAQFPGGGRPVEPSGPGRRLGGYRLLELLGRGGMGEVYRAEDPVLNRRVALKVMRPEFAASPDFRNRFLREARSAAALQHDHVVPIYHVGEEAGALYIVMPLLQGETLERRLQREARLPVAEVVRVGREAAEGLAAAHAAGLVHRDVKPANLWLEAHSGEPGALATGGPGATAAGGRVRVLDFGLARAAEADGLSQTGAVLGTPGYMAPEQIDGHPADARSDLFSLGCVLYRAATGRPPFRALTITALLRAVAEHHPPPPRELRPELPAALSDLIVRLLAKDPDHRPASARAVADALAAIAAGAPVAAAARGGPPRRIPRRAVLWAAAGLFAIGGGAAAWLLRPTPPGEAPPSAPVAPLKGVLDVRVWPKDKNRPQGQRLAAEVLPLKAGDLLRIEASLNRPAYLYLVWLDSGGTATPLWPWLDGDWRHRPADRDRPRTAVSLPAAADQGAPLEPGPSGVEVLLLLARDEPLPAGEDLAQRFAGLPKQGGLDPLRTRVAAWFEDGEPVRDEPERAPINLGNSLALEDPVWRTRALLRQELRPLFPYTRAVCFTFQGQ
jgi:tRNA A-37 threonylcarbamoyl transferase component Bud32